MKKIVVLIVSVLIVLITLITSVLLSKSDPKLEEEWIKFKERYNKSYSRYGENAFRKAIFARSLKFINEHNKRYETGLESFDVEINKFADLTNKEYVGDGESIDGDDDNSANIYQSLTTEEIDVFQNAVSLQTYIGNYLPDYVNWVEFGYDNPILDQGQCGSCYIFAALAAIEGHYFIKHKKLVQLSHQELLDCGRRAGNYGCNGGLTVNIYTYGIKNGIGYANENPYLGKEDSCRREEPRIYVSKVYEAEGGNETTLQEAVSIGPVSVAIDAKLDSFKFYKSGLYYDKKCSSRYLTHAVTIVGYGKMKDGQEYWLIRNSFGRDWGVDGYVYMARNRNNHCGVAEEYVYPVID